MSDPVDPQASAGRPRRRRRAFRLGDAPDYDRTADRNDNELDAARRLSDDSMMIFGDPELDFLLQQRPPHYGGDN
ncbi:hypothetical protein [Corynebacterium uterequi]|uniref:Uncharacterized protein n=1 Tax=Corynebacterium uterequi TaxID=1072256 RepID=A0A0G3HDD3_9CORY|nr:hypothetical protein [Corynebacterium uterequi]AKK10700.1 hypothetical protein CUTER_03460 [Corynebacterium uterequi]